MPSFLRKNAAEQVDEAGRMRAEDLVGPTPGRRDGSGTNDEAADAGRAENGQPKDEKGKQPQKPKNPGPAKVIAFANQKGGVAKTTTALNLAVAFKESGHRVLTVDMDPQGNLTMSQGVDPDKVEKSMFDVLVHRLPISEV